MHDGGCQVMDLFRDSEGKIFLQKAQQTLGPDSEDSK